MPEDKKKRSSFEHKAKKNENNKNYYLVVATRVKNSIIIVSCLFTGCIESGHTTKEKHLLKI